MAVTTIAELPFEQRDPLALLALQRDRLSVDVDYAGFGWALVDRIVLSAPNRPSHVVEQAAVFALHSADEQPHADDIELLFELDDQSVTVPLSRFLPVALERISLRGRPLVLALCNPKRVAIRRAPTRLYYAWGDVTSWLDLDHNDVSLRLTGQRWHVVEPSP